MWKGSKEFRSRLAPYLREYEHCCRLVKEEKRMVVAQEDELEALEEAQKVIQLTAEQVQNLAHARLASVVSSSLRAVFKERAYEFRIRFERKRGRTEANLLFQRDGIVLENPAREAGVGQIDIASLASRLSCLLLLRPKVRLVLILDEPFRNVNGDENRKRAASLLVSLAEELGVQVILATGYEWLRVGKVIDVSE